MIKLPKWSQLNNGDKSGSIAYSKSIDLDNDGYAKLSPRMVNMFDDVEDLTNSSITNFDYPVSFGRYDNGQFRLTTADEPFNVSISNSDKTIAEDSTSNNPNLNNQSHGVWWQNRWYSSTDTTVSYNSGGTWTASAISGLTSGVRHYMAVFKNKNSLAVSNGNTVKLYDTSHSNTATLTIPSDFEVIGLAYNNYTLAVITRLGSDSAGQNAEAYFFIWNGVSSESGTGVGIGSYVPSSLIPYQSSFAIVTGSGLLLKWNGGGFQELARFPFYNEECYWGDLLNHLSYGNNMVVDGDTILINVGFDFSGRGVNQQTYLQNNPSGVWCYDPTIGLYHKYAPSISRAYRKTITDANINTTTDIFTTTGTIPVTGNPIIMSSGIVGGLTLSEIYYIIRLTSTTFKIATTKQNAIDGNWIDITSADTSNTFWIYDIVDFGASYTGNAGAIALYETASRVFTNCLIGGNYYTGAFSGIKVLCSNVPQLENRGYLVLPKLFLNSQTENIQSLVIKHAPLDLADKIIIKVKAKEYLNIPVSAPDNNQTNGITWTSSTTGTTTIDLSDVKEKFDDGIKFELELTGGIGAGQMINISNITYSTGTYTITTEDEIVGYSSGAKSFFIIDNWKVYQEINYTNQTEGVAEIFIKDNGKSPQVKIELRGYRTTIEDVFINNKPHKPV